MVVRRAEPLFRSAMAELEFGRGVGALARAPSAYLRAKLKPELLFVYACAVPRCNVM